jgi:hypothetical protein
MDKVQKLLNCTKGLLTVFDTYAWLTDINLEDYGVSEMFKIQLSPPKRMTVCKLYTMSGMYM